MGRGFEPPPCGLAAHNPWNPPGAWMKPKSFNDEGLGSCALEGRFFALGRFSWTVGWAGEGFFDVGAGGSPASGLAAAFGKS